MSPETARKQRREHPELAPAEYAQAQDVIDRHSARAWQDNVDASGGKTGTRSVLYVREDPSAGHVLVVKATESGQALWVTSLRRLSRDQARRDAEIERLLAGTKRK